MIGVPGQAEAPESGRLVSVCDVLGDPAEYTGKIVAVVGRFDGSPNLTDMSCFPATPPKAWPSVPGNQR